MLEIVKINRWKIPNVSDSHKLPYGDIVIHNDETGFDTNVRLQSGNGEMWCDYKYNNVTIRFTIVNNGTIYEPSLEIIMPKKYKNISK